MKKYPNPNNESEYKNTIKIYKKKLNEFQITNEIKICNSKDPRTFWQYVKIKDKGGSKEIPPLDDNDITICDSKLKADLFNEYFSSVFVEDDNKPFHCQNKTDSILPNIIFEPFEVYNALLSIQPKLSFGPDLLPSIFLNKLALVLALPLSLIFTKSYNTGSVPEIWKLSHIIPLHKKGETNKTTNYRPISMTCVSARVMERFFVNKIRNHLWENKLLATSQYGFINNRSTITQMLSFHRINK